MKIVFAKTSADSALFVLHGLGLLSALAKKHGHEVRWINAHMGYELYPGEVLAITCCSDAYPIVLDIARRGREVGVKEIWVGGPHPTFRPKDFPEDLFDHVVQGEAEGTWERFCTGENFDGRRVIRGEPYPNLDDLPFVDRVQEFDFLGAGSTEYPPVAMPIFGRLQKCFLAGRGCLFRCSFCKPGEDLIFGKKVRTRSVGNVLAEIEEIDSIGGVDAVFIHDDNIFEDKRWCEEWVQRWCGKPFSMQGRASLVVRQRDLLKRMVAKGLTGLSTGYESGSDRVLKILKKDTTAAENYEAGRITKELGLTVFANMMFGIPGETKEDVLKTLEFIEYIRDNSIISPTVFVPYPGCELGEMCEQKGWSLVAKNYDYSRYLNGRKPMKDEALEYPYEWLFSVVGNALGIPI